MYSDYCSLWSRVIVSVTSCFLVVAIKFNCAAVAELTLMLKPGTFRWQIVFVYLNLYNMMMPDRDSSNLSSVLLLMNGTMPNNFYTFQRCLEVNCGLFMNLLVMMTKKRMWSWRRLSWAGWTPTQMSTIWQKGRKYWWPSQKLLDQASPGLPVATREAELRFYLINSLPDAVSFQLKLQLRGDYSTTTIAKAWELQLIYSRNNIPILWAPLEARRGTV